MGAQLSLDPITDVRELLAYPVHGQRARGGHDRRRAGRGGRLVHGAAPAGLRRPHAVGDGVPRRGGRRARRAAHGARLLPGLRRRGVVHEAGARVGARAARLRHRDGDHRDGSGGRAGRGIPVPVAQQRGAGRDRDAAVRDVPGRQPRPGPRAAHRRRRRACACRRERTTAAARDDRPRGGGRPRFAGGSPRHRLHPGARRRGGGDESDHGRAARVRAARRSRRRGATDHHAPGRRASC